MRALVYDGQLKLLENHPQPRPMGDEVLVAVKLAGVCRTDLEIVKGYMSFKGVLGHEFVGVVAGAASSATEKWQGRRVVGEINCVCGRCEMCLAGLRSHCLNRSVIGIDRHDGCFAQFVTVPSVNLHAVPDRVTDRQAVFVEPLAAAFQVIQQVRPGPKDRVAVIGDGRLGQLVAQVMAARGVRPMVVGKSETKMRRLERFGIGTQTAKEVRPRMDYHLVVECSGSVEGLKTAMQLVRPRGTIVLKSTLAADAGLNLSPLVVNEVTVLGSRCGPFSEALSALAQGEIDIEGLITAEFPLTEGLKAMASAQTADSLKVLLKP